MNPPPTYLNRTDFDSFPKHLSKYFDFLFTEYNFIKFDSYNHVRERHYDLIGNKIVIKLIYEGSYSIVILKPRFDSKELLRSPKKIKEYDYYRDFKRYNLRKLDNDLALYNSVSNQNFPDKDLWYYSKLLKSNPEILSGEFSKFKWYYPILKWLRIN
jgi:hypothetical protein